MNGGDALLSQVVRDIVRFQHMIFREGKCRAIKKCSRAEDKEMWKDLGYLRCEDSTRCCLFGGMLEKMICLALDQWEDSPLFYKAIIWEHDVDAKGFRLLELIGAPWVTDWKEYPQNFVRKWYPRGRGLTEKDFMYRHYKGQTGVLPWEESALLVGFLDQGDGIDVQTLYQGFAESESVHEEAREAFGGQTAIGVRLDYIADFRGKHATALMALFYHKDLLAEKLGIPNEFNKDNQELTMLRELGRVVSYACTPIIVGEILRRKTHGSPSRLSAEDFL